MTQRSKPAQEQALDELLAFMDVELVVLAKYMQILSGSFVEKWKWQVINIHHSFLPAFPGVKPYHQAMEHGVKLIGATAHYVTAELDDGPIIGQRVHQPHTVTMSPTLFDAAVRLKARFWRRL